MKALKYITALAVLTIAAQATAQNVQFSTDNFSGREATLEVALRAINAGDAYFTQAQKACPAPFICRDNTVAEAYANALAQYLDAQRINPNNALLNYKIGVCYAFTSPSNAPSYFEKALSLYDRTTPEAFFYMAHAYQQQGLFDEAITYYQKYKTKLAVRSYATYAVAVDKYIAECHNAISLTKEPVNVFVDNTGKAEDIAQNVPLPSGRVANTMQYITADKKSMILSSTNKKGKSHLYETYVSNDVWTTPKALKSPIKSSAGEQSAFLTSNGMVIFFSSVRKGGYGNYDIYMAQRDEKGKWGYVVNLGAGVNTPFDEHIHYVSPDGLTIYFTSRGHNTMGGFDVFKSTYSQATNTWGEAENLGYPINSVGDETSFAPTADNKSFYITSTREGGYGKQDVFLVSPVRAEKNIVSTSEDNLLAYHSTRFTEFLIEPTIIVQSRSERLTAIAGMVVDQETQKPLRASISLLDNAQARVIARFESNGETGRFTIAVPENVNYGLVVTAPGYMFQSDNVDVPAGGQKEFNRFIEMPPLQVDRMVALRNVFFEFGKATYTEGSKFELDLLYQMLVAQPSLKIQIAGHTDNRGSADINMRLSDQRAKSVVDYLVRAGIEPERLSYIGFGMFQPMAPNTTDAGRALNRRTEIKIMSK